MIMGLPFKTLFFKFLASNENGRCLVKDSSIVIKSLVLVVNPLFICALYQYRSFITKVTGFLRDIVHKKKESMSKNKLFMSSEMQLRPKKFFASIVICTIQLYQQHCSSQKKFVVYNALDVFWLRRCAIGCNLYITFFIG